jgi:hypothetical protein
VLDPDWRSPFVQIFKDEAADPDPGHFDIGHDVAGAYALDASAPIELLALAEEVTGLLRVGDGKACHGCHGKRWIVVDRGEGFDVSGAEVAGVTGEKVLNGLGGSRDVFPA